MERWREEKRGTNSDISVESLNSVPYLSALGMGWEGDSPPDVFDSPGL